MTKGGIEFSELRDDKIRRSAADYQIFTPSFFYGSKSAIRSRRKRPHQGNRMSAFRTLPSFCIRFASEAPGFYMLSIVPPDGAQWRSGGHPAEERASHGPNRRAPVVLARPNRWMDPGSEAGVTKRSGANWEIRSIKILDAIALTAAQALNPEGPRSPE